MTDRELIQALRGNAIRNPSRCFGCGYEHNCNIHGCQIERAAADRIQELLEERAHLAAQLAEREEGAP